MTHWNWKSAMLSAGSRGLIFFIACASSGWAAALTAMNIEFIFRAVISGWFGSLTERVARYDAPWSSVVLLFGLTVAAHLAEWALHAAAGTTQLTLGLAASVAFSVLSTAFNLFAMRRGTLVVGAGRRTMRDDLLAMPALIRDFVRAAVHRVRIA